MTSERFDFVDACNKIVKHRNDIKMLIEDINKNAPFYRITFFRYPDKKIGYFSSYEKVNKFCTLLVDAFEKANMTFEGYTLYSCYMIKEEDLPIRFDDCSVEYAMNIYHELTFASSRLEYKK